MAEQRRDFRGDEAAGEEGDRDSGGSAVVGAVVVVATASAVVAIVVIIAVVIVAVAIAVATATTAICGSNH